MAAETFLLINAKDNATAVVKNMTASVSSSLSSLSVMGGNLAAQGMGMAIGAVKDFAREAINMGGQLTDASLKTGISAQQLQVFWDAAKMAGMEASAFDSMVVKMNKNLASGSAADALKEIGINAKDLAGKGPAEQFQLIGSALADVKDQGTKTKVSMDIFGKSGADIFAMLGTSSEEFQANMKDSADNVKPMSDSVVAYLDVMGDSMDRARQNAIAMTGTGLAYAASVTQQMLSPAVEWLNQQMADLSSWNQENAGGWQMLADFGIQAFNGIASSIQFLWATGKLGFKNLVDSGRIRLENLVEIGFWLYDNFSTIFSNIPQLAMVAFKAVAQIVGGVFSDIVSGNIGGIGDTINKAMADAGKNVQSIGISKLQLEDPAKAIDQNWQEYYKDIAGMNTDAWTGIKQSWDKGIAAVDTAGKKKGGAGPLSEMVEKEKKAKAELAGLYQAGTADAYDMLAKAGSLNSPAVSAGMATTTFLSNFQAGSGDLAIGGSAAVGKLEQVVGQLTTLNNTMAKIRTS